MDPRSIWPNWNDEKPYAALVLGILFVLFLSIIAWLFTEMRSLPFVGRAPSPVHTIAVTGEGKIVAVPNIASISLGVDSQKTTEQEAVADATTKMNALVTQLKALGIKDEDLKTEQYTVYPRYDYPNGKQVASGYEAQQQLTAKVRDASKLPQVLKIASDVGANQIGDLQHTIDDPEPLRAEARLKAIANAQQKAGALAQAVGVQLGRVVSFDESSPETSPQPIPYAQAFGVGGGGTPAPDVQAGSQDVISDVTLTYEIY